MIARSFQGEFSLKIPSFCFTDRLCLAVAALGFVALIGSPAFAVSPEELAKAKATIKAANVDWIDAVRARDAHRIAAPYAEDAINVTGKGVVIVGRAALEQAEAARFGKGPLLLDGSLEDDGLQVEGELIYEWGHSALRWKGPDGEIKRTSGQFLTVWRQEPDHQWRIIRNLSF